MIKYNLLSCVTFFNCSLLLTEVCEPVNVFYENHQDMTKMVDKKKNKRETNSSSSFYLFRLKPVSCDNSVDIECISYVKQACYTIDHVLVTLRGPCIDHYKGVHRE